MKIEHFGGWEDVTDEASLDRVLAKRYWLSAAIGYPTLSILVRDGMAALHYFPQEDHPGFLSRGSAHPQDPGGSAIFYTNTPQE